MNSKSRVGLMTYAQRTLLDAALAQSTLKDGILSLMEQANGGQSGELATREAGMKSHREKSPKQIMAKIAQHHSLAVMGHRAATFRQEFPETEWILDIGGGTGWYWKGTSGANIALVDFSLEKLYAARLLLGPEDRVLLIHADASQLPFQPRAVSGFWSVQVLQHLPSETLYGLLAELKRVGKAEAQAEFHNLNYAWLHRVIYRLLGRRLHHRGVLGNYLLNRLTAAEWCVALQSLSAVNLDESGLEVGYSELFYHPNFRLLPTRYPVGLERFIAQNLPSIAALFARQVHLRIKL